MVMNYSCIERFVCFYTLFIWVFCCINAQTRVLLFISSSWWKTGQSHFQVRTLKILLFVFFFIPLEMCSVSCCPIQRKGKATSYPWKRFSPRVRSWRGEACLRSTWSELGRPSWKPSGKPCTTALSTDTWTSPSTYGAWVSWKNYLLTSRCHFQLWACLYSHFCALPLPRGPLDFTHLVRVSANVFLSAPPTSDPGSPERVQLHRGRGVHRGAGHARPSPDVSDPQGQQGNETGACRRVEFRGFFFFLFSDIF